jgi:hypothetical protein
MVWQCGPYDPERYRGVSGDGFELCIKRDSDDLTETSQPFRMSYFEFSLESLILAQDERWRRA